MQRHHQANFVIDPETGEYLEYRHLIKGQTKAIRENSLANEIVQLAQGFIKMMPSIFFIPKGEVTAGRTVTYGIIVAKTQPQKAETHRTQLTVGGNLIEFPGDVTTTTAGLITSKLIFHSVLSTKKYKIHVRRYRKLLFEQSHGQI